MAEQDKRVQVVLLQSRDGLGEAGETVEVGEARAARWESDGIAEIVGKPKGEKAAETAEAATAKAKAK